jgi:hypothetical protein
MTSDGEHRGAKRFAMNLSKNTCTCGVIVDSCSLSSHYCCVQSSWLDFLRAPFMATYNTLEALVHTWSPRFISFLDEEQRESYDCPRYVANKAIMWKKRGPRRRARYAIEMDRVELGCSKRSKVNSESVEDRHEIHCSKCHKAGYN